MAALVLKEWKTSDKPLDKSGNFVVIRGRQPGTDFKMIPLASVSSTYYGYHKPWAAALGMFFFLLWIIGSLAVALPQSVGGKVFGALFAFVFSAAMAILYYFLKRTLTLGFVEESGIGAGLQFKRSVVEGIEVDEQQARYICEVTQFLIESARRAPGR
jgi:hypothetical protein